MNDKYWLKQVKEKRRGKRIHHAKRELARALVGGGMTYQEVADTLEISVGSVHNVLKEPPAAVAPIVREMQARLAHKTFMLADHILSRICDYDLDKARLKEKALAAAILMDKARMLAERPEGSPVKWGLVGPDAPVYELKPASVQSSSENENHGAAEPSETK